VITHDGQLYCSFRISIMSSRGVQGIVQIYIVFN